MVLQVLAHLLQLMHRGDAVLGQQFRVADAGELQQLRRVHRAGRKHHFATGRDALGLALMPDLDAGDAAPLGDEAQRLRAGPQGQVGTPQGRLQEGRGRGPAQALLLVDLEIADTFVIAAVEIGAGGDALLDRRGTEQVEHLPAEPHPLDTQLAVPTVMRTRLALAPFAAQEMRQHVVPAPARVAELAPVVVVGGLAAHVDHAVDGRGTADHLAARVAQRSPVQARHRLGAIAPVGPRVAHGVEVADRDVEPDPVILAAGLEQQHRMPTRRRQPVGQRAAGTARPDHDVVEARRSGIDDLGVQHGPLCSPPQ